MLAILSEFTPGQAGNVGSLLCCAVELRVGNGRANQALVVKDVDVRRVIRDTLRLLSDHMQEERDVARKRKEDYDARQKDKDKVAKKEESRVERALDDIVMDDMGAKMSGL
jgi:hypothetical protein